ncbi:MAG: hypothetical protein SFX73_10200 [Kofleriaceae bacterium]|nr:hypothetical protein [Kofleriaceae bacterium]
MDRRLLTRYLFSMQRTVLLVVVGLMMSIAGCITPSIPIPPPDPAMMTFELQGEAGNHVAIFEYPPNVNYEGSIVFVYNRDRGVGVIEAARPDGSVGPTAPVRAELDEQMVVTFQREDQTVSTCIRLREGPQSSLAYCDP